ncbi:probable ATP-dependent RNA helicase DDX52 isoform X1 [Mercenaria mercenaria]|uniref:probable ATP-dependent RNA helicase DDX52 isoform X1 n=1 Tax=Mercenaria mercenaria TaxID=6596 RepID=UPI00234E945E|nr:probable ATP-dependent RNA helicase DDX52 isoform X1 [Mercenaria mercenaria]
MDAYDLFRKLGSGAKFDFKRFRSDAEKLHLVKSKVQLPVQNVTEHSTEKINDQENIKNDEPDSDQDSSESDSGSSQTSSDTDEDSKSGSSSEDEVELQLLGNIRSKGDEEGNNWQEERKRRKQKRKNVDKAKKLAELKQEQINHVRNINRVHAYGTDIPEPVETFEELKAKYNIHSRLIQNIEAVGYKSPTPIQIQAIPVMLHRRELMACAPTGSGKTAAFIIPILHHLREPRNEGIRGLVLAPTRELAKQTFREFQRLSDGIGFRIQYIDKTGSDMKKIKKATKKCDILVSTPNRLIYLLKQQPPVISLTSVQWLVVDESDKLFEEGKTGFRGQLAAIYKSCDGTNLRRAMFSATFAYDVEEWCKLNLDNVIQVYVGARNSATKTIEQSLLFCGAESGKLIAIRDIIRKGIQPPVLVFVQSKERAKELFHELIYDGMNVDVIHADRTQLQRDNVIKSFRAGKIWILICTELMGRGIDFKGVNLVINYDFPNSAISYIHRIGRTGRAGRSGKAVTFFTEDDAVYLRSIANVMRTAGCPVPDYMLKINQPSRQDRKKLSKAAIKRKKISTVTKYDLQKNKHKRRIIHDSKKKKYGSQEAAGPNKNNNLNSDGQTVKLGKRKHLDSDNSDVKKRKFEKKQNFVKSIQMKFKGKRPGHLGHGKHQKGKSGNKGKGHDKQKKKKTPTE